MTSGCIWGPCKICGELVYEDEVAVDEFYNIVHDFCKRHRGEKDGYTKIDRKLALNKWCDT
mgnify:CR=1 FL=1